VDTPGGSGLYYVIFSFLLLCFTMHKLIMREVHTYSL
jgi:hypothetical protein